MRAASSISRVAATISRPSAGTRLPASKRTMSPGTSSAASISIAAPSRRTRAMSFNIFSRAARLASAFDSCRRPSTALNTVRPTRTIVVPDSPVTTWFTTAAPTRMICIRSWYWRRKACERRLRLLGREDVRAVLLPPPRSPPRRTAPAPDRRRGASPPPPATAGTSEAHHLCRGQRHDVITGFVRHGSSSLVRRTAASSLTKNSSVGGIPDHDYLDVGCGCSDVNLGGIGVSARPSTPRVTVNPGGWPPPRLTAPGRGGASSGTR